MFAVVKSGGRQYKVRPEQELAVDRLPGDVGDEVELSASFLSDGDGFDLSDRTVKAEIVEHFRGDKIHIYKYKSKKTYRKKTGHRQELTRIKVLEV